MSSLTETNLETSIDAARGYRRTSGNRRSKEATPAASGAGLPSALGCKDPMYQEVLSLSNAPERCSGAFCLLILIEHFLIGTYPRSHGENLGDDALSATPTGASPLTRGKPRGEGAPCVPEGLIPAHAGKTPPPISTHTPESRAHPRSRGGKLAVVLGAAHARGLIPTHAGKTCGM